MMLFWYMLVMALTTYAVRALPLVLFRGKLKNRFLCSFLAYVPCACLAAMTVPSMLFATGSVISALLGLSVAILLAYKGQSLVTVAVGCSLTVLLLDLLALLL